MLIVFDTCEHLLGACAALTAALLPACAKVQILATSPEPLRVPGESTLPVRPFQLRDPANPVTRHQSLRAAIGWSHELCTPAERLLWARLSVFTGPFGLRDTHDVCTTSQLPEQAVTAGLSLLTERSILLADARTDGEVSYLLPLTLRGYGQQMLRRLAADAEFQDRYQRWQQCGNDAATKAGKSSRLR